MFYGNILIYSHKIIYVYDCISQKVTLPSNFALYSWNVYQKGCVEAKSRGHAGKISLCTAPLKVNPSHFIPNISPYIKKFYTSMYYYPFLLESPPVRLLRGKVARTRGQNFIVQSPILLRKNPLSFSTYINTYISKSYTTK